MAIGNTYMHTQYMYIYLNENDNDHNNDNTGNTNINVHSIHEQNSNIPLYTMWTYTHKGFPFHPTPTP